MRTNNTDCQRVLDRQLLVDVGFISLLIAFLTAVHVGLPASSQAQFVFNHEAFDPWTLLTSAYIHHDMAHLRGNLRGFLIGASAVYLLCWRLRARRWFRITTATFLITLPILVNLSSYAILGVVAPQASPTGRGFSGVVAGFGGFLFIALSVWIASHTSRAIAAYLTGLLIILMTWTVSLIYSGFEIHVAGLVVVGMGFSGWGILTETDSAQIRSHWRKFLPEMGVGFGIILVLFWFVVALFPPDFTSGEVTTNIFAHAAGFAWGVLIALVLWKRGSHLP